MGFKYTYNVEFFKNESADLAYFMGFLMSDGNIDKFARSISISIQERDKEILDFFQHCIGGRIEYKKFFNKVRKNFYCQYKYRIHSQEIVKELFKYSFFAGPKGGKEFIPKIDSKFYPDFIRGVFDGDGSAFILSNKCYSSICSSNKDFLVSISNILPIKSSIYESKKNFYDLRINARETMDFRNYIYYNNNIFGLQRKKDKLFSTSFSNFKKLPFLQSEIEYLKLHINKKSLKEISKILNKSMGIIRQKIDDLHLIELDANTKHFTAKDISLIKNNYNINNPKQSIKYISEKLNRTYKSVSKKILKMGIKKNINFWKECEIEYLKNNLNLSLDILAKELNRNKEQISYQKKRIKKCQAI